VRTIKLKNDFLPKFPMAKTKSSNIMGYAQEQVEITIGSGAPFNFAQGTV